MWLLKVKIPAWIVCLGLLPAAEFGDKSLGEKWSQPGVLLGGGSELLVLISFHGLRPHL